LSRAGAGRAAILWMPSSGKSPERSLRFQKCLGPSFFAERNLLSLKVLFSPFLPNVELPRHAADPYPAQDGKGLKKLYFF
jgi:hypothetical protein